jgi:alpha-methylacyl-CoA racemase
MAGLLHGVRTIEMARIAPSPFAVMMIADHGAEVIQSERPGAVITPADPLLRTRTSVTLDLKKPDGIAGLKALCLMAGGLIEGYRPGVMERLGLDPDVLPVANPTLACCRMTGWGQDGPWCRQRVMISFTSLCPVWSRG